MTGTHYVKIGKQPFDICEEWQIISSLSNYVSLGVGYWKSFQLLPPKKA